MELVSCADRDRCPHVEGESKTHHDSEGTTKEN